MLSGNVMYWIVIGLLIAVLLGGAAIAVSVR